jgi:broad specificity phosphatase PhoE
MKISFIRHAISEGNKNHKIYNIVSDWNVPLADEGFEQAEKVKNSGKLEHVDIVFCSPYLRCKQTCDVIFTNNKIWNPTIIENPLLVERDWCGLRDIVDGKEFNAEKHFHFFFRPPGGESFFDVYQRVVMFFQELRNYMDKTYLKHDNKHVCIVSHGEWIRVALMYLRHMTVEEFQTNRIKVKNCEIFTENYYE